MLHTNLTRMWMISFNTVRETLSSFGLLLNPELSSVAFGILVMSPENATCERAFSVMKYLKNDQHSCLTQLHLDNALRIALEDRKPTAFPFEQLLHWHSSHAMT